MRHGSRLMDRITQVADLPGEPLPTQPLLELYGMGRVLIEHHKGIAEYSCVKVRVKVASGYYCICGNGLEVSQMSNDQIVITGCIESVTVIRR